LNFNKKSKTPSGDFEGLNSSKEEKSKNRGISAHTCVQNLRIRTGSSLRLTSAPIRWAAIQVKNFGENLQEATKSFRMGCPGNLGDLRDDKGTLVCWCFVDMENLVGPNHTTKCRDQTNPPSD
jgi:hypothetical protein